MGIEDWLEYHGMCNVQRINITGNDDHISEIIMGYRPVFDSTSKTLVISVIIRGTNTSIEEWSSNMDIGDTREFSKYSEWTTSAHHMGFDITSNRIMDAVAEYIEDEIPYQYDSYSHTYWVTGHSRGGALANLVAAKLIDGGETVFAYTFAAPATIESTDGAPHEEKYDSIFNIVNEDDFIPYFPLEQWNFTLYGRTTQNVSISSSYSALWTNSWKDSEGAALGTAYMRMESPTAPLAEFYRAAGSRNACYDYVGDWEWVLFVPSYPDNTTGYYEGAIVDDVTAPTLWYVNQKPMFLMKYFAAVAAKEVGNLDFYTLDVADYLEEAKELILEQATGYDYLSIPKEYFESNVNKIRLEYPHLPQTYCLLAMQLTDTAFN